MDVRPLRGDEVGLVAGALGLERLLQGDGGYLVAWELGRPVGHAHLTDGDPPELQDLAVLEARRRHGVATALLGAAEAACRDRGASSLRVEVGAGNDAARALYAARGFVDEGTEPRRVTGVVQLRSGPLEVDDTLVAMRKPLS